MKKGFTLIELLIVISIFVALIAFSAPIYSNWQAATLLDTASEEISQAIRQAKTKSEAGYNNFSHGVYFNINPGAGDSYITYQGATYAGRDTGFDIIYSLPESLVLTEDLTDADINFSRGLGRPSATGTITLLHSGTNESVIITINNLGFME